MYINEPGETSYAGPQTQLAVNQASVDQLLAGLGSDHDTTRRESREALVALGEPVVPGLMALLSGPQKHVVRWEAAKALSMIGSPTAVPALISALEDKEFDIRWLAAEGLAITGAAAVKPLLQALCERPGSQWLREGAHHVLKAVSDVHVGQAIAPVVAAMEGPEPQLTVGPAAQGVLAGYEDRPMHPPR